MSIPTSTSVSESAVIDAPLAQVWHKIKLQSVRRSFGMVDRSIS
jgi:hypothetical protein